MQAALTARQNGHDVILCEKTGELGGLILCEKDVPFKKRLHEYITQQAALLKKSGVDLRLNTEATPEYAKNEHPDVIIAAIGSKPATPDIPGIGGANVHQAIDIFKNPDLVKGKALILGAGFVGTELAIYLKERSGIDVSIVEMTRRISDGGNDHHMWAIEDMLEQNEIPIHFNTKAVRITQDGVVCEGPGGEIFFDADTVIHAVGMKPLSEEAVKFDRCAETFHMVGDCQKAATILLATGTAHTVAKYIGRNAY